ncbi:MAG: Cys-tRNA(Pro) deacylase [Erysipelotrichaceae bacterium]
MTKTNAMRLLDLKKINYKVKYYEIDEIRFFGAQAIDKLDMDADCIFKTLVTKGDKNGINIFCIPANAHLDLKKAAKITHNKKIEMVHAKQVYTITGYMVGACSPIGMKKLYPTFIDESAILFDEIGISGGLRGCELILKTQDLCTYTDAQYADLTEF